MLAKMQFKGYASYVQHCERVGYFLTYSPLILILVFDFQNQCIFIKKLTTVSKVLIQLNRKMSLCHFYFKLFSNIFIQALIKKFFKNELRIQEAEMRLLLEKN